MNKRRRNIKKRLTTVISWLILAIYITLIAPSTIYTYLIFYPLLFTSILLLLKNWLEAKRSILYTCLLMIYLLLRQLKIDSIFNLAILISILIMMELYFRKA